MNYFAHTKANPDGTPAPATDWQPLAEHLRNVADLAADFARPFGLEQEARLAGLRNREPVLSDFLRMIINRNKSLERL